MPETPPIADVLVVGGGLIGTAIARSLARRGAEVRLVADERDRVASPVAAGMLAPITEAAPTETALLDFNREALVRYGDFVDKLVADTGMPVELRRTPTLTVGFDADDTARLRELADFLSGVGVPAELMTSRAARREIPLLAPQVRSGLWVAGDWSVDNRELWHALRADAEAAGVTRVTATVTGTLMRDGACVGVRCEDGTELTAATTVIAAGAWSGGLELGFELPIRPVKGQVLRLRAHDLPRPAHTVRAFSRGFEVYLVPRDSGEIVVGATVEDRGFDPRPTAGGVYELLRDARRILPIITEYELAEINVGYRPTSRHHAPIIGRGPVPGLVLATGHHRNGVLQTPITADLITELIIDGHEPGRAARFNPYHPEHRLGHDEPSRPSGKDS